ncbi:MAG: class I SAM-dependent methyltransferase [Anaerolineales bacterium]|nr:class I SAM-dependent methyltransferase [Anaerolineales bacterium]
MSDPILNEQIEYYRARAKEYDQSISSAVELFEAGKGMLLNLGNFDQILELACGTGFWTETLTKMGGEVTAVDAAPEMLQIARERLGEKGITYQQADLFKWEPEREYDLVFFANWLSHVPPSALETFLSRVQRAVRPDGYLAIVDQYAPSVADEIIAKDDFYAKRPLEDGREFTIVKAFYNLNLLEGKLNNLGFEVSTTKFTETFFFLSGKRVG